MINPDPYQIPPNPPLPKMTIAERGLWAISHRLPSGILLVYEDEMNGIGRTLRHQGTELLKWQNLGRAFAKTQVPEDAIEAFSAAAARLAELEKTSLVLCARTADGSIINVIRAVELLDAERRAHAATRKELAAAR